MLKKVTDRMAEVPGNLRRIIPILLADNWERLIVISGYLAWKIISNW